jgi:hypothetical protein
VKKCTHCGESKDLDNFRILSHGYHASWCRGCYSKEATVYGLAKIQVDIEYRERALIRSKKWTSENREHCTENQRKWRQANPLSIHAHNAVQLALRSGKLKKKPCVICGSNKNLEAHHRDYDKPLDVVWLCRMHHSHLHHKKLIA